MKSLALFAVWALSFGIFFAAIVIAVRKECLRPTEPSDDAPGDVAHLPKFLSVDAFHARSDER